MRFSGFAHFPNRKSPAVAPAFAPGAAASAGIQERQRRRNRTKPWASLAMVKGDGQNSRRPNRAGPLVLQRLVRRTGASAKAGLVKKKHFGSAA